LNNSIYSIHERRNITSLATTRKIFLSTLLDKLNITEYNNNKETQLYIENMLYEGFEEIFLEKDDKQVLIGGINKDLLGGDIHKYMLVKQDELKIYLGKLLQSTKTKAKKKEDIFTNEIISKLKVGFLLNLCFVNFLQIFTHQYSENDKKFVLVPVAIKMGKKMVSAYLNELKDQYVKKVNIYKKLKKDRDEYLKPIIDKHFKDDYKDKPIIPKFDMLYSDYKILWETYYPEFVEMLDDNIYAELGCKIIDILERC
jgi:hypothetical protein